MNTATRNRQSGFTLVELLVAITLFAFLSLALLNGLHLGSQIWRQSEETITRENHIRTAKAEIASLVSRLYPEFVAQGSAPGVVAFAGEIDHLTFLAPDENLAGSLNRVEIARAGDKLVVATSPELAAQATAQTHVLLKGVQALSVFYYGAADSRSAARWSTHWAVPSRPPALIQFHIDMDTTQPVELTVAPRIQADMSCSYSALTQYCEGRL